MKFDKAWTMAAHPKCISFSVPAAMEMPYMYSVCQKWKQSGTFNKCILYTCVINVLCICNEDFFKEFFFKKSFLKFGEIYSSVRL